MPNGCRAEECMSIAKSVSTDAGTYPLGEFRVTLVQDFEIRPHAIDFVTDTRPDLGHVIPRYSSGTAEHLPFQIRQ